MNTLKKMLIPSDKDIKLLNITIVNEKINSRLYAGTILLPVEISPEKFPFLSIIFSNTKFS